MDRVELCERVKDATRQVMAVGEDRLLKTGTGVTVSGSGIVLTAGHVICGDDGELLSDRILVETDDGFLPYSPVLSCGLALESDYEPISGSIEIDLNILAPPGKLSNQSSLPLSDSICQVGEGVILAGYPDEISVQVHPDDMIDFDFYEGWEDVPRLKKEFMSQLFNVEMLKRGMVGNVQRLVMSNVSVPGAEEPISIEEAYYGIDTHLTDGGSGGPVVNSDGEVVGIVIKRSRTELDNRLVRLLPADTGLAISHRFVSWVLDGLEWNGDWFWREAPV